MFKPTAQIHKAYEEGRNNNGNPGCSTARDKKTNKQQDAYACKKIVSWRFWVVKRPKQEWKDEERKAGRKNGVIFKERFSN